MRTTILKDLTDAKFVEVLGRLLEAGAMPDTLVRTSAGLTYMEWPEGKLIQAELELVTRSNKAK